MAKGLVSGGRDGWVRRGSDPGQTQVRQTEVNVYVTVGTIRSARLSCEIEKVRVKVNA